MARITVEDCLQNVNNRFELVMLASQRARQIAIYGKDPIVPLENDKATVLALREIAAGYTDFSRFERDVDEKVSNTTATSEIPQAQE